MQRHIEAQSFRRRTPVSDFSKTVRFQPDPATTKFVRIEADEPGTTPFVRHSEPYERLEIHDGSTAFVPVDPSRAEIHELVASSNLVAADTIRTVSPFDRGGTRPIVILALIVGGLVAFAAGVGIPLLVL